MATRGLSDDSAKAEVVMHAHLHKVHSGVSPLSVSERERLYPSSLQAVGLRAAPTVLTGEAVGWGTGLMTPGDRSEGLPQL